MVSSSSAPASILDDVLCFLGYYMNSLLKIGRSRLGVQLEMFEDGLESPLGKCASPLSPRRLASVDYPPAARSFLAIKHVQFIYANRVSPFVEAVTNPFRGQPVLLPVESRLVVCLPRGQISTSLNCDVDGVGEEVQPDVGDDGDEPADVEQSLLRPPFLHLDVVIPLQREWDLDPLPPLLDLASNRGV